MNLNCTFYHLGLVFSIILIAPAQQILSLGIHQTAGFPSPIHSECGVALRDGREAGIQRTAGDQRFFVMKV